MSVELVTSRDVMAELTRHRLASFCIESQRYVCMNGEIAFILPRFYRESDEASEFWEFCMADAEQSYHFLLEKGLKPEDIDLLIISHLHFDHAGGLSHFVGTKAIQNVIVSEADLKEAYFSVMTGNPGAYIRTLFDVGGIQFKPIHETTKLADDLTLFIQKSHTPGVIGLILHTENHGNIIATSDTVYTAQSYRDQLPPGGTINKTTDEFFENIHRIQALEKEYDATLLFGHDIDQITDWAKKSPID